MHEPNICDIRDKSNGFFAKTAMDICAEIAKTSPMKDLAEKQRVWLADQLVRAGRGSRTKLAEHLRVRPDAITRMVNDAGKETREITAAELFAMADFFGVPPPGIATKSPEPLTQEVYPVGETEPILRRLGPHTLPVLGITMGGDTDDDPDRPADFWMNGEIVNYVARPRSLENAKDVFALYVDGTSMFPRFREKDMVVVQKLAPAAGDDVVIELKPRSEADEGSNASFLKEFVRRAGGSIVVKQYNPEKEITFDLKEIKNLFRVIPTRELMS